MARHAKGVQYALTDSSLAAAIMEEFGAIRADVIARMILDQAALPVSQTAAFLPVRGEITSPPNWPMRVPFGFAPPGRL